MDYSTQTVAQLKEILKEKDLSTDGKKADLISRLKESEEQPKEEPKQEQPEEEQSKEQSNEQSKEESTLTVIQPETKKEEQPKRGTTKRGTKKLTPEERKSLAIELLNKKISRAEKFNDEESLNQAKKDLIRVEKFGVELGTSLAKELGLVSNQLQNGIKDRKFKPKHKRFRKNIKIK